MNTADLQAQIVHRITGIYDNSILEEINSILDFKTTEQIFRCSEEQRLAIAKAQKAVANGEFISNEEMIKAVELCLNEN